MEDSTIRLIYNCMHDHSLKMINSTAKTLNDGITENAKNAYLQNATNQGKDIEWELNI